MAAVCAIQALFADSRLPHAPREFARIIVISTVEDQLRRQTDRMMRDARPRRIVCRLHRIRRRKSIQMQQRERTRKLHPRAHLRQHRIQRETEIREVVSHIAHIMRRTRQRHRSLRQHHRLLLENPQRPAVRKQSARFIGMTASRDRPSGNCRNLHALRSISHARDSLRRAEHIRQQRLDAHAMLRR